MIKRIVLSAFTFATLAAPAFGQVWPQTVGSMHHVMIDLNDNGEIVLHLDDNTPLEMNNFGELHNNPADVLDGMYYNDQYGWLADGVFSPPAGAGIWIRLIDATNGLEFYEGGMRMMKAMHTYSPLFGTDASSDIWQWGGTMTHHWIAAPNLGSYSATFEVFVGDVTTGTALSGYTPDQITLNWQAVPEPTTAALLLVSGLIIRRRRARN